MVFTKRRLFLWGALIALVWVVFNSITPAGSDPLGAQTSAFAMRGKNLFSLLKERGLFDGTVDVTQFKDSGTLLSKIIGEGSEDRRLAFDSFGCVWNVAAAIPAETDDMFPVMISANFNPKFLSGGDRLDPTTQLPIGAKSGADRSLLDDRAIVVVRRNGMVHVIKAKDLKWDALACGVDNRDVEYLTPTKRVRIIIPKTNTMR